MSGEIRITIEDDEVFERMRRRKDELDLSWEEVLRRGLDVGGDTQGPGSRSHGPTPPGNPDPSQSAGSPSPFDPGFGEYIRRQIEEQIPQQGSSGESPEARRGSSTTGLDEWISDHVETTIQNAISSVGEPLDREIERLEGAEDATLVFEHLSEPGTIPLRIDVRSDAEGFDVDVVATRQGKDTTGMNTFDEADRKAIARHLVDGGTAALRIGDDSVTYDAYPSLEWGRDASGTPTVTDVEIEDVDLT